MSADVTLILIFLALALGLFLVEPFVPSFGLFTLLGLLLAGYAVDSAFFVDSIYGWGTLILACLGIPSAYCLGFKLMRRTSLVLKESGSPGVSTPLPVRPASIHIGKKGVAVSALRPMGVADFSGCRIEVLSQNGIVPPGTEIRVVSIRKMPIEVVPLHGE